MLGRGLEALIPSDGQEGKNIDKPQEFQPVNSPDNLTKKEVPFMAPQSPKRQVPTESVFQIEVENISPNPHQPRRHFDEEALKELAMSIREFGVLQPLIVTKIEKESEEGTTVSYELIAGERRLMASKLAGLHTVPAIIRNIPLEREKLELAVIENIQREDLNPVEEARAYSRLQDEFKLTQREIAARLGKSREVVANRMRLLNLPSEIQEAIADGKVNESQARLLLSVEEISRQREFFAELMHGSMTVRELKAKVSNVKAVRSDPVESEPTFPDPEMESFKEQLEEFLGTEVDLTRKGGSGKISITFYSPEELNGILDKILKSRGNQFL